MECVSVSGAHIRKSIQTNIHFFCSNSVNPQVLLINLLSRRVISQEECNQIEKLPSNFDRNCKLYLLILEKLGSDRDRNRNRKSDRDRGNEKVSQLLIKALNESGNELIVHKLKSTEFSKTKSESEPGFADETNLILQNRVENNGNGRITEEKDSNNNAQAPKQNEIRIQVSKVVRFHSVDVDLLHSNDNVLPPLKFSFVHGANIHVFQRGEVAKRVRDFCNGIVFTDRPVAINERVCVKLAEISKDWSGFFRFGFTNQDPNSLRNSLPLYLLPEPDIMSPKSSFHFWAKAFSDFKHPVAKNSVVTFLVNPNGDVIFSVNGFEKGIFFTGIETKSNLPLWAVFDIYGNTTALELIHQ